jgi:hypothetical protein
MDWIISRFPDETVKTASACQRENFRPHDLNLEPIFYRLSVNRSSALT